MAQWSPGQWERISAELDHALDLSGTERERRLLEVDRADAALGRHLRELLAMHQTNGASDFLASPLLQDPAGALDLGEKSGIIQSPLIGKQFGSYRVLSLLGHGGMGSVWLAERVDGLFARQVALKLVHPALVGGAIMERFTREREILASLNHPHIARLLDAGLSTEGQPYIAIEYIAGTPLTQYCDERRLSVVERLGLFGQVLGAVQYAHTHLIIHRDLKPSNILVNAEGQVRLLDFGIAKLLTDGESKETVLTQVGGRALTPGYAAPEQFTDAPMTTVTDVYALGVMLYELMAGQRPYQLKRDSRAALEEAILQSEPKLPSRVAFTAETVRDRSTTAEKLSRVLKGDLDTIVIKALKKAPAGRYQTASAFAEDIGHYLAGERVLAQPDTVGYRAVKFARRNWIALTTAGVLFLALAGGLAATTYEAKLATQQRDAARAAQMRSLTQSAAGRLKESDVAGALGIILEVLANRTKEVPYTPEALNVFQEARAADLQILALTGHTDRVYSASFSRDGQRIVTGSFDKTARIWDATTGQELLRLRGHADRVTSAAFSHDIARIVTASADNTARIWDAATGRALLVLKGHTDTINVADFSPDGRRVATASSDKTVRIWDAASGQEQKQLTGHSDVVESVAFSPDGKRIVTASDDKTARIWDAATGRQIMLLGGHTDLVEAASFSPDGLRVVTASDDRTVRIWDVATGRQELLLSGHEDWVVSAAFSPDGKRIVTASVDRTARLWDAATGRELKQLTGHTDRVTYAAFSPDGERVVTASVDATARVWDVGIRQQQLIGHTDRVWTAVFSPGGERIVTASYDKTARIWDTATSRPIVLLSGHTDRVTSAAFSPDGERVVTMSYDRTARVWDARTGRQLLVLTGHTDTVNAGGFSPDGRWIVTASGDRSARIWDAASGNQVSILVGHTELVEAASFSPDGRRVVTASDDKTIRIWDSATARQLLVLSGHADHVISAAFSPDGRHVISASSDRTSRIWDAASGEESLRLSGPAARAVDANYSPDGRYIVTALGDRTARVWDSASGQQLMVLSGHADLVEAAAFSPDSRRVVTASDDRTARIWGISTPAMDLQILWTEAAQFDPLPNSERFQLGLATLTDARQGETNPSPCDQAAGAPYDPERRAAGVMLDQIVADIAIAACAGTVSSPHSEARLLYQRARAEIADGQLTNARRDLEIALAQRYRVAQVDLGVLLLQGSPAESVPRAISLFEGAWKDGITIAGFELGELYENGVSRPDGQTAYLTSDTARARLWYQRAADAGDPNALARIAEWDGEGTDSEQKAGRKAHLLKSFKYYAAAVEAAHRANWPDDASRAWRYRRASLARALAHEGMTEDVAYAYARAKQDATRPRTMWQGLRSFSPID